MGNIQIFPSSGHCYHKQGLSHTFIRADIQIVISKWDENIIKIQSLCAVICHEDNTTVIFRKVTVTITHILNNKSGINFGSYAHTGLPVEVLVQGVGAESFDGYYDNTDIYSKMAALLGVQ